MNRILVLLLLLFMMSGCLMGTVQTRHGEDILGKYPYKAVVVDLYTAPKEGPPLDCIVGFLSLPIDFVADTLFLPADLVAWAFGYHRASYEGIFHFRY